MDTALNSINQYSNLGDSSSINSAGISRTLVAGRYIEGNIEKIKVPTGRDLVLLPDSAPHYAAELSSLIQKAPFRQGLTPGSREDFLEAFRQTINCATWQEAACRDAWLEDVYELYEWYKNVFLIRSANITIGTLKERPSHFDGSTVQDFHVDMPAPKAISSALLVKAFPPPGLTYATLKQDSPELPEVLERQAKVLAKLRLRNLGNGEEQWKDLDEERSTLSLQVLSFLDESTITSVPDHFGVLYNGSYCYGLIHRSPHIPIRRAIVTISGYSYRGDAHSTCRESRRR